jgi:YidC/Oxa1 family membrane protein insertase
LYANIAKALALPVVIVGLITVLAFNQPVEAAPPTDTPNAVIGDSVQESDILFDKSASAEMVMLGQPVTYTISIKNNGGSTISPELIDTLPNQLDGLALQEDTITTTLGTASGASNVVTWAGTLEPGQEALVIYQAIPPSTSSAGQRLTNSAILNVNGTSFEAAVTINTEAPDLGLWGGFVNFIAKALVFFDKGISSLGVPYAFGFAIILFTLTVRAATFPLNMQQIKSSKAMQALQPQLKAMQEKYKNDREALAREQMALYKEAGVNPLGGCLPMLVQMPIWFALYRALIQLSSEGLLNEGFFWIPSLAGPVSDWGGGIDWLWPFPPSVGWPNAIAYLIMPVLLVVSQLYMQKLMTPPSTDPQQAQMQSIMKFMPLMFGYFALIVPSGLTLYWFTSNILGVAQHYFTKTQFDNAPAVVGSGSKKLETAPATATSGDEKKQDNAKPKRKSRRKR